MAFHSAARQILCVGRNYAKHCLELGNPIPKTPVIFAKTANCVVPESKPVLLDQTIGEIHHEVELAVVIGKNAVDVPVSEALNYVKGYCIALDLTARDVQAVEKKKGNPWELAKSAAHFLPLGETLIPSSQIDPANCDIELKVNGQVRQVGNTSDFIFPVPELISYLSHVFTLNEGDIVLTGTPAGVAKLVPGDVCEAQVTTKEGKTVKAKWTIAARPAAPAGVKIYPRL